MTKLIYITHPSVEIDKAKLPHEWGLSEKGFAQAELLLEQSFWPTVDVIYSSLEPKAMQVAKLAAEKFGIPWQKEKDLGEADRTATPFLPLDEYMAAIQDCYRHPTANIKGWESHHHMMARNAAVIDQIERAHHGKTIAIIGHGGAGTTVKCHIKGVPLQFSEDPQQTGCIFIADLDDKTILQDWEKY